MRHKGGDVIMKKFSVHIAVFACLCCMVPAYAQGDDIFWGSKAISCLATIGDHVFAGTWGAGIYHLTPESNEWEQVSDDTTVSVVTHLSARGDTLFAATANATTANGSLLRSGDHGHTWAEISTPFEGEPILTFAVCGKHLFAITSGGDFYHSFNNGTGWEHIEHQLPNNGFFAVSDGRVYFASRGESSGASIFVSGDDDEEWNIQRINVLRNARVLSFHGYRGILFAGVEGEGIQLSNDNGKTFRSLAPGIGITEDIEAIAVNDDALFAGISRGGMARIPLSDIIEFATLTLDHYYECPVNFYDFHVAECDGAAAFDFYANGTLLYRVVKAIDLIGMISGNVIDDMLEKAVGPSDWGERLTFSVTGRSANDEVTCISQTLEYTYDLYIGTKTPDLRHDQPAARITGSTIDCRSLKGEVRITLYSLSGKKVWSTQGTAMIPGIPSYLPRGIYTVKTAVESGTPDNWKPAGTATLVKW